MVNAEVMKMMIDTKQLLSVTDANRNFSRATRIADVQGQVFILKNNHIKYKLVNLEKANNIELTDDEKIDVVARRILNRYRSAFEELAK